VTAPPAFDAATVDDADRSEGRPEVAATEQDAVASEDSFGSGATDVFDSAGERDTTNDGATDAAPPLDPSTSCRAWATALCARRRECAPGLSTFFRDELHCIETTLANSRCVDAVTAAGSAWSPARVAGCTSALRAATCAQVLVHLFGRELPECLPTPGGLGDGAICHSHEQCKSQRCSGRGTSNDGCGKCVAKNDACESDWDCSPGSHCTTFAIFTGRCSDVWFEPGAACNADGRCVGDHLCEDGRCVASRGPGVPCTAGECSSALGLGCSVRSKTCVLRPTAGAGANCSQASSERGPEVIPNCGPNTYCESEGPGAGTCRAVAKTGDPCSDRRCATPNRCVQGICRLPATNACR
jgi:hypothetical protein